MDGIGNTVKVRSLSLAAFQSFLIVAKNSPNLNHACFAGFYDYFFQNTTEASFLIDDRMSTKKLAVVVFPNVIPRHAPNFLISFLLQFDRFENEFDLFDSQTISEAFQKGGLINSASSVKSQDVDRLLRIFILKRVMFVPGSHVSQDRQIVDSKAAFSML